MKKKLFIICSKRFYNKIPSITNELNKSIYLYNDIPLGILKDEIIGFNPIIINGNLEEIK